MKIYTIVDALSYGDGVGNDIVNMYNAFKKIGMENIICAKFFDEKLKDYVSSAKYETITKNDIVIYHYCGYSNIIDEVLKIKTTKIIRYHNITPPSFFDDGETNLKEYCANGLKQLKDYIDCFDYYLPDSNFNRNDLIEIGANSSRVFVLPCFIDSFLSRNTNEVLEIGLSKEKYFIVIGRIVQNKCVDYILKCFEAYYHLYNKNVKLYIIGSNECSESYSKVISNIYNKMQSKPNVVITGKVSQKDLNTYYKYASGFICMSEHEGFCIPIVEAMRNGVPIICYNSSAISETMNGGGILINNKQIELISFFMNEIINNNMLRKKIIEAQYKAIKRYDFNELTSSLKEIIENVNR